jgi:HK97 family phage major capsid protein
MPYNNLTSRTDVGALIPEQVSRDMLGRVRAESAVLTMFRRVPVAGTQVRFPILSALPVVYWVSGDTGLKQTTEAAWSNKYLNIEELAAIVPIPESVADDLDAAGVDIWEEIRPELVEAVARALDSAVFFGTNAPGTFPTNISAAAAAAGNTTTESAAAAAGGIQDDVDRAIELIEADGYEPNGIVAVRSFKGRLRRARDVNGQRLIGTNADYTEYEGLRIAYPMRGLFPAGGAAGTNVRAFIGDYSEFVVGVRQDIRWKLLDQAVIQDGAGVIVYNLAQQDMVALRLTFRAGWQVSNRINNDQPVEASRYPVARLMY